MNREIENMLQKMSGSNIAISVLVGVLTASTLNQFEAPWWLTTILSILAGGIMYWQMNKKSL